MKIAVVILNWNGKELLAQFLPSVVKYSTPIATVYVVDNNSSDDSVAFVKEHFKDVQIVQNSENGGYAKGYNDALKHIEADIYCLVNSDIEVTEGWLMPVLEMFKNEANVASIQPKILDHKDKAMFEYAGAAGGYIDAFGYPYCRGRIFSTLEKDEAQYNDNRAIFWASGACFFIRSQVFHQLNGFDEDYFAHQEEIDLCWRIHNANYKIKYVADAVVYHVGGATLNEGNPKKTYLNFRNSLFTLIKNIPQSKLIATLFVRMLLDGLAAIRFLLTLKPRHALAVLKAHLSFYRNVSRFKSKRKDQLNKSENYFHSKSIVWYYFIRGKKKFSQLQK